MSCNVTRAASPRRDKAPTLAEVVALARRMIRGRSRDLVLGSLAEASIRLAGQVDDDQISGDR